MAADIFAHPSSSVTFDAPQQPAPVQDVHAFPANRLHLDATPENGRRPPSMDTVDDVYRLEALRWLGELMDRMGSDTVRVLAHNLAALRREQGRW